MQLWSLITGNPGPEIKWSQFCGKDVKGRNLRVTRVRNVRSADFGFGDKILRRQQFHSTHSLQISLLETFSVQSNGKPISVGLENIILFTKIIILQLYFLFEILWGLSVIFHIIGFRHNNANFGTNSDFHQDCLKYYFSWTLQHSNIANISFCLFLFWKYFLLWRIFISSW